MVNVFFLLPFVCLHPTSKFKPQVYINQYKNVVWWGFFLFFYHFFVCFVFGFVFVLLFFCGYKLADINIATYYTKKNQEKVL